MKRGLLLKKTKKNDRLLIFSDVYLNFKARRIYLFFMFSTGHKYLLKVLLLRHATIPRTWFRWAMPKCSGSHILTCLVHHATLSEFGPIREENTFFTRDNSLATYSGMPKIFHYFAYDTLWRMCPNYVTCYMIMSESIRTAGVQGKGVFKLRL